MALLKIGIDLENAANASLVYNDEEIGTRLQKVVPYRTMLRILNEAFSASRYIKIPRLPQGTVDFQYLDEKSFRISLIVPAGKRRAKYMSDTNDIFLPYPTLLFVFCVENGKSLKSTCYATTVNHPAEVSAETQLYAFPYGNVNSSNGDICFGGNHISFTSVDDVMNVIGVFFSAEMNNDLYHAGSSAKTNEPLNKFIGLMKNEEEYPSDLLVPSIQYKDTAIMKEGINF